jgi:sterol desaturase/sphingolipid hydroxylase (fatty acid hydroxylase superfamily)
MTFTGNYASTFIVWDWVFGTDVKYREHRKQKGEGKMAQPKKGKSVRGEQAKAKKRE